MKIHRKHTSHLKPKKDISICHFSFHSFPSAFLDTELYLVINNFTNMKKNMNTNPHVHSTLDLDRPSFTHRPAIQ